MNIVEAAREYIGTPFHHQGRLKGVGIDCVGLLVLAAQDVGLEVSAPADYARTPDGSTLLDQLGRYCARLPMGAASAGDVLAFRMGSFAPHHVALISCVDPLTVIHAHAHVERCCEHKLDRGWRLRVHSAWRLRITTK